MIVHGNLYRTVEKFRIDKPESVPITLQVMNYEYDKMTEKIYIRKKENRQDSDISRPPRCLEAFTLKVIEIYRFHDERRERHIGQRFVFTLDSDESTQTVYQHVRRFIVTVGVMMR